MIFDSHAHYNDEAFKDDVHELLNDIRNYNVGCIMNACANLDEMDAILALCTEHDEVYGSVGIHPEYACSWTNEIAERITEYTHLPKICAVGEIGLDYYWDSVERSVQKECFDKQLALAEKLDMPVIIHDREAHGDTLDIVGRHKGLKGVFHCFSGSAEMAKEVLDLGYYIALGGSLTFKNNKKTVEVAKYVPLSSLLVETDCPYLTPVPNRGKRNFSGYLKYVIQMIADIKGVSFEEVENATYENAMNLYKIKR